MIFDRWSRWLPTVVLGVCALLQGSAWADPRVVPGQVLVGFRNADRLEAASNEAAAGVGQVVGRQRKLRAARMRLHAGVSVQSAVDRLRRRSDVEYVEPLYIRRAFASPNDSYYPGQWALPKIDADEAWDLWQPQAQVVVAIVDTGVDMGHPDLVNVLARDAGNAVVNYNAITGSSAAGAAADDHGHGTHCAGIAAAQVNNAMGVAGVAGWNPSVPGSNDYIKIMPVKALDDVGEGTDADVAEGIIWAADHGADIISLSLGGEGSSVTLSNATYYARNKGCVVIAAAGNDGVSTKFYPAANTGVVSVGATDSSDTLASFSNWGTWVKVAAPGVGIYSTYPLNRYVTMSGTSMAAPHVAGEAAAVMAQNPSLTRTDVEGLIIGQVDPYAAFSGRLLASGAGRINLRKALEAAGGGNVTVASVVISPVSVIGGASTTGTITLTGTAPTGGTSVTLSSDSAVAVVPGSVQVLAGQITVAFTVSTTPVSTGTSATITAAVGSGSQTATVQVQPPTPATLTFSPSAVDGGQSSTGTVTLSGPAPAGGILVQLDSGSSVATPPASVIVGEGTTSAAFTVTTISVSADTGVTLSATFASVTRTGSLTVRKLSTGAGISALSLSPATVSSGGTSTATVTLSAPAPAGGVIVSLSVTGAASVPASVVVPAGGASATITVTAAIVPSTTIATVTGTFNGTRSATLTVEPQVPPFQLSVNPASVRGGRLATGALTLSSPAKTNMAINLASGSAGVFVPNGVTIRRGSRRVTFSVRTLAVATSRVVTITATSADGISTAQLTVTPPAVRRVRLKSSRVRGGKSTVATVYLDGPAPAEGLTLHVTANQVAVEVPATVVVMGGKARVSFPVQTSAVFATTVADISVSVATGPGTTRLTILPNRSVRNASVALASVRNHE